MEKRYAYSILTERALKEEDDFLRITGIASTPTTDRMGDIVEPLGAKFATPMPLLWQHRHGEPVGHVTFAKPKKTGIPFEAQIPNVTESGRVKDRVDEARHSLKYSLVSAVSIGFLPMGKDSYEYMDDGGIRFKEWEWIELSLVTIPANAEAVLETVKSLDSKFRRDASSGLAVPKSSPGGSGKKRGFFYLHRK